MSTTPDLPPLTDEQMRDLCRKLDAFTSDRVRLEWESTKNFGRLVALEAIRLDRAARAGSVPAGFVLVPIEPTEAMQSAGRYVDQPNAWDRARETWTAMLAAAPAAPSTPPDEAMRSDAQRDVLAERRRQIESEWRARVDEAFAGLDTKGKQ